MVTGDVVSLLLGNERPRSAMAASFAVVLPVLQRKFPAAGATVAVAAPLSIRSFHLRLTAVAAVTLNRIIRRMVIRVPVERVYLVNYTDPASRENPASGVFSQVVAGVGFEPT
jgi:hypothetical protein